MSARFGFSRRLHRPEEFSAVLSARRVIRGERFVLHYLIDPKLPAPRLGLIVPKRLAKAASLRNSIKRQAREVFRSSSFGVPGVELVFRLDKTLKGVRAADRSHHALWRQEFALLLARLSALTP